MGQPFEPRDSSTWGKGLSAPHDGVRQFLPIVDALDLPEMPSCRIK
jgi:hypothetical protein